MFSKRVNGKSQVNVKALVLHGPGDYTVESDWPKPSVQPGWAIIRVRYAAICGSDLPRFTTTGSYHYPIILGHEFAGEIEETAPHSTRFRGGERVAVLPIIACGRCDGCSRGEPFHCEEYQFLGSRNNGGFAEYCLVPEDNLFELPPELALRTGALIEPAAVALHAVRRSGFMSGQSALILGAGAIGLLIGLWLRAFDACRIAVADIRDENIRVAHSMGFAGAYNPKDEARIPKEMYDHTFEAAGANAALLKAIEKTKSKGVITVIGRDINDTIIPLKSFETLMRKELSLRGCWGYNLLQDIEFFREVIRRESFDMSRLISSEITLDEAPETIKRMADKSIWYLRVVIKI